MAYQGSSTYFDGERVTRVPRDKKAEQAAVKALCQWGFEEDEGGGLQARNDCFFLGSDDVDNDAEDWLNFQLEGIPKLRAQGWCIEYDNFRFQLVEASHWYCDVDQLEKQDWFSMGLGVEVDGRRVDLLPTLLEYLHNFPRGLPNAEEIATQNFVIPLLDEADDESANKQDDKLLDEQPDQQLGERLLLLPTKRILPLLEILLEMVDSVARDAGQHLHLNRVQLARFTALDHDGNGPACTGWVTMKQSNWPNACASWIASRWSRHPMVSWQPCVPISNEVWTGYSSCANTGWPAFWPMTWDWVRPYRPWPMCYWKNTGPCRRPSLVTCPHQPDVQLAP